MPCHCLLSILFLVTDCSVLYSLSLYAQYYIPCPWVLSIIFIVPVCLVFYSLSLTAQYYYYIPCHCLLRIIFIVTDCSVLSTMFIVTLAQYYIPCHWLPYFETNLYSLSPTFSVFLFLALLWTKFIILDTNWYASFPWHHCFILLNQIIQARCWTAAANLIVEVLKIFCSSDRQCDRPQLFFMQR